MDDQTKSDLARTLSEMAMLSGLDGFRQQCALSLREVVLSGSAEQIAERYCSRDWWGGSGSMADFIPEGAESRREFLTLLIKLELGFSAAGHICPRARQWTSTFQQWLDEGVV